MAKGCNVQKKITQALDRHGWQMSLARLVQLAGLPAVDSNRTQACQIRKRWLAAKGITARYIDHRGQKINRPDADVIPISEAKPTLRQIVFRILEEKGVQSSVPTLVSAVKKAGYKISLMYATRLRKDFCAVYGIEPPDCRTNKGQPERDMDQQCSVRAWEFLVGLMEQYKVPLAIIKRMSLEFESVKLQRTILNMERTRRVAA